MREKFAELEHKQWASWTEYFLENNNAINRAIWRRQTKTPYRELSDEEKNSDREWADKVIEKIIELIDKDIEYQKTFIIEEEKESPS